MTPIIEVDLLHQDSPPKNDSKVVVPYNDDVAGKFTKKVEHSLIWQLIYCIYILWLYVFVHLMLQDPTMDLILFQGLVETFKATTLAVMSFKAYYSTVVLTVVLQLLA